jgi:hypothetical protein
MFEIMVSESKICNSLHCFNGENRKKIKGMIRDKE